MEVVHIEDGNQTLIKILTSEELESEFFAEVETLWSRWEYACTVFEQNPKYLFCFGSKLPTTTHAVINAYQLMDEYGSAMLVFSTDFVVPELAPTPTNLQQCHQHKNLHQPTHQRFSRPSNHPHKIPKPPNRLVHRDRQKLPDMEINLGSAGL
jgi:hypothetical protein